MNRRKFDNRKALYELGGEYRRKMAALRAKLNQRPPTMKNLIDQVDALTKTIQDQQKGQER